MMTFPPEETSYLKLFKNWVLNAELPCNILYYNSFQCQLMI